LGRGLDLEQELFSEVFATEDARIGIDSFRREGPGKARFTGR
jgi:enoyl-CoA hydratase